MRFSGTCWAGSMACAGLAARRHLIGASCRLRALANSAIQSCAPSQNCTAVGVTVGPQGFVRNGSKAMRKQHLSTAIAFLTGAGLFAVSAHAADWLQFGYDQAHSGNNPLEDIHPLGTTSTAQWTVTVHASGSNTALPSDSTPVYLSVVRVGSRQTKDLIFLVHPERNAGSVCGSRWIRSLVKAADAVQWLLKSHHRSRRDRSGSAICLRLRFGWLFAQICRC